LEETVKARRRRFRQGVQDPTDDGWTVVDECWSDEEDISESGPYEVIIIKEGFSNPLSSENQFHTGASITLLKGPMSIIVDTGHPKDRDLILQGLETNGVLASDVECCISTHSHVDHIGNLNIFQDAVHVTYEDICLGDIHHKHDFGSGEPFPVADDVDVIHTPGHTSDDISVLVKGTHLGTVAIVGDLFQSEDDQEDPTLWRSRSRDPDQQEANRRKILQMADYIIPGHGKMFKVPNRD
jgi:glyoxylase-like metal-dependent hydrolase (beta-lactamase superfamily II)